MQQTFLLWYNTLEVVKEMIKINKKQIKNKITKVIEKIKDKYLLVLSFIVINLINSLLLRLITVKNIFSIHPLLIDIGLLLLLSLLSLLFKRKNRIKYFMTTTIILTMICLINSVYYHYYDSFATVTLISNLVYAKDVGDAIFENVLKPEDLIYLWGPIAIYLSYYFLKKKKYFNKEFKNNKKLTITTIILTLSLWGIASIIMPITAWGSFHKLWNRESVVMNYGIYIYQIDDIIQSISPKINSAFGHDKALKETELYYQENKYEKKENKYTNIFEGKNVIVIHAESIQNFVIDLEFNNKEVTPNLNKLTKEGIYFNNFYSQVGVGTSSDTEFTFNTSLMPSTKGTVFVNYFDREYVSIPKLLKEKGYYTYSMHANAGEFWNRNIMHETLGYNKFYSKNSYVIDETIGLGLSDKSFFSQSADIMKEIKETEGVPFYSTLIMLSNHTPFSDLELMPEYETTINVELNNRTITREYISNTDLGNYIRSVHYADEAIGEFINKLDKEGLLDNTVLLIYGDHDARLDKDDFNLLYNYDPVEDRIKEEGEEGYVSFNDYDYELNRKVPFIIWTKDKKINTVVDTPMGMIDVLPTIGNMLGIHSEYQLGNDIFNLEDNIVTFVDGSFVTSNIYYSSPKEEIYPISNEPITEEYIQKRIKYSSNLIDISNNIISYDLIKELSGDN